VDDAGKEHHEAAYRPAKEWQEINERIEPRHSGEEDPLRIMLNSGTAA
jgi:hypothetical protein